MQVLTFVCRRRIDFPEAHLFESNCITTKNFYKDIYRLAGTKAHVHHSHVTGEINSFARDFCP